MANRQQLVAKIHRRGENTTGANHRDGCEAWELSRQEGPCPCWGERKKSPSSCPQLLGGQGNARTKKFNLNQALERWGIIVLQLDRQICG